MRALKLLLLALLAIPLFGCAKQAEAGATDQDKPAEAGRESR